MTKALELMDAIVDEIADKVVDRVADKIEERIKALLEPVVYQVNVEEELDIMPSSKIIAMGTPPPPMPTTIPWVEPESPQPEAWTAERNPELQPQFTPEPPPPVHIPDVSETPEERMERAKEVMKSAEVTIDVTPETMTEYRGYEVMENGTTAGADLAKKGFSQDTKSLTYQELEAFPFDDSKDYIIVRGIKDGVKFIVCSKSETPVQCSVHHKDGRQCQYDEGHEKKHFYGKKIEPKNETVDVAPIDVSEGDIGQQYGKEGIALWRVVDLCRQKALLGITQTFKDSPKALQYAIDNFNEIVKELKGE
jgi:hypothetical protein